MFAGSTEAFSNFPDSSKVLDFPANLRCLINFFNVLTAMKLILKTHAEVMANAGKGARLNVGKIATIAADVSRSANFLLPMILFFLTFIGFNFFAFSFLKPFLNVLPFFSSFFTGFILKLFIFSFIPFLSFFCFRGFLHHL
ncbi:hypothetical protein [Wolbachia endosymbiont (group A) of Rhorus exstirpatorius]|uniref:hypothetical protein n=1 Tax=Wolbachia endosymbiont (group A) of Rhorus exstirpatorius TaxID=3066213 RepID=UPI003342336A